MPTALAAFRERLRAGTSGVTPDAGPPALTADHADPAEAAVIAGRLERILTQPGQATATEPDPAPASASDRPAAKRRNRKR